MASILAPVTVWDPCAKHHWLVWVLREQQRVLISCLECDTVDYLPLEAKSKIWHLAQANKQTQIVQWIEMEGSCYDG